MSITFGLKLGAHENRELNLEVIYFGISVVIYFGSQHTQSNTDKANARRNLDITNEIKSPDFFMSICFEHR